MHDLHAKTNSGLFRPAPSALSSPTPFLLPAQLQEAFPDCAVSKEGSALDHLVVLLLDGREVWRADTRTVPILAAGTTNQAVAAARAALAPAEGPPPAAKELSAVENVAADCSVGASSVSAPAWVGKLDAGASANG